MEVLKRTGRQKYKDSSYAEAIKHGCDTVQLKYDGWWCRMEIINGEWKLYSRTERYISSGVFRYGCSGTFIGEYMFGTNWAQDPERRGNLYVFDCLALNGVNLVNASYRDRYCLLQSQKHYFPEWLRLVENFKISDRDAVWNLHVEPVQGFEGLVYRRVQDPVDSLLLREKKVCTAEFRVNGFEEGEGKYRGSLGALVCGTQKDPTSAEAKIGSGFTDEERQTIWDNQASYKGRWLEAEGKTIFEATGLLRHPTFLRWVSDRQPADHTTG
jgi:ATP-dependent DNA ligase